MAPPSVPAGSRRAPIESPSSASARLIPPRHVQVTDQRLRGRIRVCILCVLAATNAIWVPSGDQPAGIRDPRPPRQKALTLPSAFMIHNRRIVKRVSPDLDERDLPAIWRPPRQRQVVLGAARFAARPPAIAAYHISLPRPMPRENEKRKSSLPGAGARSYVSSGSESGLLSAWLSAYHPRSSDAVDPQIDRLAFRAHARK